jgi:hypothetical protein
MDVYTEFPDLFMDFLRGEVHELVDRHVVPINESWECLRWHMRRRQLLPAIHQTVHHMLHCPAGWPPATCRKKAYGIMREVISLLLRVPCVAERVRAIGPRHAGPPTPAGPSTSRDSSSSMRSP